MSGETRWTEALDEFMEATGKRLAVFAGSHSFGYSSEAMGEARELIASQIVHNMFQFVERHGAQGGKHAEGEPRPDRGPDPGEGHAP